MSTITMRGSTVPGMAIADAGVVGETLQLVHQPERQRAV